MAMKEKEITGECGTNTEKKFIKQMCGTEWAAVWQSIFTGNSRRGKIVTIGLTKIHSLALMVCVCARVWEWLDEEGGGRLCATQSMTKWTDIVDRKMTKKWDGARKKKKKGRIKAVEAKCAGFTSKLTWTASSPSLYINLSQEKSQE